MRRCLFDQLRRISVGLPSAGNALGTDWRPIGVARALRANSARLAGRAMVRLPLAVLHASVVACTSRDGVQSRTAERRQLDLTEERVEKLTPPASLAGAALGAEGSIFAWFNDRPDGLWITTDGRRYFIAPPALRGPVGAIFLAGERVAEVVDTATSDIRRVNISGEVTSSRPLRAGMPVLTAVYTDSCWYIGGAPSASRFVVARVQPSGDAVSIADFSAAPRDSGAPAVVGGMLAPLGRGVLVALRAAPHTTVVLDSLGRSLVKVSDTLFSALMSFMEFA